MDANIISNPDNVSNYIVNSLDSSLNSVSTSYTVQLIQKISSLSYLEIFITLLIIIFTWDQISYKIKKSTLPGPSFKWYPIIGPFLESLNPKFEEYVAKWNSGKLTCVSIFHKFIVISSDTTFSRKIFQSSNFVKPCVVDVAFKILRPTNWVFLDGKAHTDYRKSLNQLFTRGALEQYLPSMEIIMDKYIDKFINLSKDIDYKPQIFFHELRELLCAISLKSFCGDYITDNQIRAIADDYYKVTAALELVNFPIIIPFTKTWYGKRTADAAMKVFEDCAARAKIHIANGGKPICVLDAWCKLIHDTKNNIEPDSDADDFDGLASTIEHKDFSNREMSEAIFTFLFASQDASSSLACWMFQIMADRPDVMKKVREEQLAVRNNNPKLPVTIDLINEMKYTNMVITECLRYRPPVIMVPYIVKKNFQVSENYVAPKGSMVIPSCYPALHDPEVYENPEEFIPERWEPNSKASKTKRNWLVFGCGPHVCLGQKYVFITFAALMGKFAMFSDWEHQVTDLSEKIKVFATIFPMDDLLLTFKKRDPLTGKILE